MSSSIPLIRASAAVPAEMWLTANGYGKSGLLKSVGLPPSPAADPARLVSLHSFLHLLSRMAEMEGPDIGARIATPEALMQLDTPARAIRRSRTVREALQRVARSFHHHASHVFFLVADAPGGLAITAATPTSGTAEMHHQAQLHVAAVVCSLGRFACGRPLPAEVRLTPHPRAGLEHVVPYLGQNVGSAEGRKLSMWIPDEALDVALPPAAEPGTSCDTEALGPVACTSLSGSARILIAGMLDDGDATIDAMAMRAGRSRRTLQRLFAAEGTSFAELLDSVRENQVISHLSGSGKSVSAIAEDVGFRNASSLTRAVRRWTNTSPRQLRRERMLA